MLKRHGSQAWKDFNFLSRNRQSKGTHEEVSRGHVGNNGLFMSKESKEMMIEGAVAVLLLLPGPTVHLT